MNFACSDCSVPIGAEGRCLDNRNLHKACRCVEHARQRKTLLQRQRRCLCRARRVALSLPQPPVLASSCVVADRTGFSFVKSVGDIAQVSHPAAAPAAVFPGFRAFPRVRTSRRFE